MVESVPDGDAGTYDIVARMRTLVRSHIAHPVVRDRAVSLAAMVPPHDISGQIAQIRKFLASRVHFVNDPDGPELLHSPVRMLETLERSGMMYGDCDDVATLGAALGQSIGIPARFVVVGFYERNAPFTHVWAELYDGIAWRELDTTRPYQRMDGVPITRRHAIDLFTGDITMLGAPRALVRPPRRPFPTMVSRPVMRLGAPEWPQRPRGVNMGALPAIIATGTKVATWASSLVSVLKPFWGSSKDPERFKATDAAHQQAVNGNEVALLFLRQRTGDYGVVNVPGVGEVGGWGSGKAKAYAREKYADALRVLGKQPGDEADTFIGIPKPVEQAAFPVAIGLGLLAAFVLPKLLRGRG